MSQTVTISLMGVRAQGYHGVLESERSLGQTFVVDAEIVATAPVADDIETAINYAEVARLITDHITGVPVALIETLAQQIARDIAGYKTCRKVSVTVHKPQAPVGLPFDDVSVTYSVESAR